MAEVTYAKKRLEPIITKFNIDVEKDKVFQSIIVLFNGQTDYQMWALKLIYGRVCSMDQLIRIKQWADANPTEIQMLSKHNLVSYKTATDLGNLITEMQNLDAYRLVKNTIAKFNTEQRHLLSVEILDPYRDEPINVLRKSSIFRRFYETAKLFEMMPNHRQQKFFSLMSAVRSVADILHHMENSIKETYEWNREDMLSYAKRNCPDIEVCYDQNNIVILRIPTFESSQKLCGNGRTSWCLTRDRGYFNRYTKENSNAQQFFLFNFNVKENHELAHVGFSVNPERGINYAHSTRNNNLMGEVEADGKRWNIHKVLDFHKIGKNVYIRLKQLRNYVWNADSFLTLAARKGVKIVEISKGRYFIRITTDDIFNIFLGHTLNNFQGTNNQQWFAVLDFNKEQNDDKSILLLRFGEDKYKTISFKELYDAYGVRNTNANALRENNLDSEMFVEMGEIEPNLLLHKLIDEQDIEAAVKLLSENKDLDPNNIFQQALPITKAIKIGNPQLFSALINHDKFNMSLLESWGEPYAHFLLLHLEAIIEEKSINTQPYFEMVFQLLKNPKYNCATTNINLDTILHISCEAEEFAPIVEYLVGRDDIDINAVNDWGYKAIDVCLANNKVNMKAIKLLMKRADLLIDDATNTLANERGVDLKAIKMACGKTDEELNKENLEQTKKYSEIFQKAFGKI